MKMTSVQALILSSLLSMLFALEKARAELSPQAFQTLKNWAEMQGYPFKGLESVPDDHGHSISYWRFGDDVNFAIVLTTVSSVIQAEAAFQASQIMNLMVTEKYLQKLKKQVEENSDLIQKLAKARGF